MTRLAFHAVIPARYASSRLPGKPLLELAGKPLIERVHDVARQAEPVDVTVATDDGRIARVVRDFGGNVALTSPECASGTDRLAEVAIARGWRDDELVVNVQGDEPLLPAEHIRLVARTLNATPEAGIATLSSPIEDVDTAFDPNAVKVVVDAQGFALYFSRATIPWQRDAFAQGRPASLPNDAPFARHIGLYAYRVGTLKRLADAPMAPLERAECLEQLRALWLGIRIVVSSVHDPAGRGVDTPEDLERVRQIFLARR